MGLVLVSARGAGVHGAAAPLVGQTPRPLSVTDAGDFYFFDGKPVHLDRATSECVVGLADGTDPQALVESLPVPLAAGQPMLVKGRRFVLLTLQASQPAVGLKRVLAALRARPDVWFVSRISCQPATNEVVVRYAGGVNAFGRLAQRTPALQRVSQPRTEGPVMFGKDPRNTDYRREKKAGQVSLPGSRVVRRAGRLQVQSALRIVLPALHASL